MRTSPAHTAAQRPPSPSRDRPACRRGELGARLAALVVAAQLVFLPIVAISAAALVLIGRLSRWRLHWLLVPGLGGMCWLTGYWLTGYRTTGDWTTGHWLPGLSSRRGLPGQLVLLLHPGALAAALARTGHWLPVYLLAATGEATIVLWLTWRRSPPGWRPGLVATQRERASIRALVAGRTVTCDGCAVGVEVPSGRLAAVSWAAAERGILLAGHDERQLAWPALAAVCAAIRRRKTVLVLDFGGADAAVARQVAARAADLGVRAAQVALPAGRPAAEELETVIGRAIRHREIVAISAAPGDDAQPAGSAVPAVKALASVLESLRDLGLRGDCLTWIAGCEAVSEETLRALLALGQATGTAVLLSTVLPSNARALERLAAAAGLVIVADAVPGRFSVRRAVGRAAETMQAVSGELAAARLL